MVFAWNQLQVIGWRFFYSDFGSYSHHLHLIFTLATMFEVKNLTFNEDTFGLHPRGDLLMLYTLARQCEWPS